MQMKNERNVGRDSEAVTLRLFFIAGGVSLHRSSAAQSVHHTITGKRRRAGVQPYFFRVLELGHLGKSLRQPHTGAGPLGQVPEAQPHTGAGPLGQVPEAATHMYWSWATWASP